MQVTQKQRLSLYVVLSSVFQCPRLKTFSIGSVAVLHLTSWKAKESQVSFDQDPPDPPEKMW